MSFGNNLRITRKARGLTQDQLAEMLDVSRQAVSKWEQDSGYPETEKLIQIAKTLEVSLDYLMDNKPSENVQCKEKPESIPTESAVSQPDNGRIIITVFDGSRTVECLSVRYDKIQFPAKNEPEYILMGVDRVGFFGEHTVILAWYDDEESVKNEMSEILSAIEDRKKTYKLKYFTDVRFTLFGTTERK